MIARFRNVLCSSGARRAAVVGGCMFGLLMPSLATTTMAVASAEPPGVTDCGRAGRGPDGRPLRLIITSGNPDCEYASSVLADYRASPDKQGSGGFATVDGWDCGHDSIAGIEQSATVDACQRDGDAFSTRVAPH